MAIKAKPRSRWEAWVDGEFFSRLIYSINSRSQNIQKFFFCLLWELSMSLNFSLALHFGLFARIKAFWPGLSRVASLAGSMDANMLEDVVYEKTYRIHLAIPHQRIKIRKLLKYLPPLGCSLSLSFLSLASLDNPQKYRD